MVMPTRNPYVLSGVRFASAVFDLGVEGMLTKALPFVPCFQAKNSLPPAAAIPLPPLPAVTWALSVTAIWLLNAASVGLGAVN